MRNRIPLRYTINVLRETLRSITRCRKNARTSSCVSVANVSAGRPTCFANPVMAPRYDCCVRAASPFNRISSPIRSVSASIVPSVGMRNGTIPQAYNTDAGAHTKGQRSEGALSLSSLPRSGLVQRRLDCIFRRRWNAFTASHAT